MMIARNRILLVALLIKLHLANGRSVPIKGSNPLTLRRGQYPFNTQQRELGVGSRPDVKDPEGSKKEGNDDQKDKGGDNNIEADPTSQPLSEPIIPPATSPTLPPTPPPTPGSMTTSTFAPSATATLAPSSSATATSAPSSVPTSTSSIIATIQNIVTRSLLPFEITLEGQDDALVGINIPLKLSLEEFLSSKMDESFDSSRGVILEEVLVDNIQRQTIVRSFGYEGKARFNESSVPTTERVQNVQQQALSDFIFELEDILKERNITVNIIDVFVEDNGGDTDIDEDEDQVDETDSEGDPSSNDSDQSGDDATGVEDDLNGEVPSETSSTAILVAFGAGAVMFSGALMLYRKRRSRGHEEPNLVGGLVGGKNVDHMIDTSAAQEPVTAGEFL
jgi:hypothetical protein